MRRRQLRLAWGFMAVLAAFSLGVSQIWNRTEVNSATTISVGMRPSPLAIDLSRGRIYVVNQGSNTLSVLDLQSQQVLRTVAVGVDPEKLAVDGRHRRAVIVSPHSLRLLDTANLQIVHTVHLSGHGIADVALDPSTGHIFISEPASDLLSVYDVRTARLLQRIFFSRSLRSSPGTVMAYPAPIAIDYRTKQAFVGNPYARAVSVLDTQSGHFIRTIPVGGIPTNIVVDVVTARVAVSTASNVSILDGRSGRMLSTLALSGFPTDLVVDPKNQRMLVLARISGSAIRSITSVNIVTGRPLYTVSLPSSTGPAELGIDGQREQIIVAIAGDIDRNGNALKLGQAYVLDERTGHARATMAVGVLPANIAVDERSGQAIIVNQGGTLVTVDPWKWMPGILRRAIPFLPQSPRRPQSIPGSVSVLSLPQH